jgi:hypothetical protein
MSVDVNTLLLDTTTAPRLNIVRFPRPFALDSGAVTFRMGAVKYSSSQRFYWTGTALARRGKRQLKLRAERSVRLPLCV